MNKQILVKFLKGALTGGLAAIATILATGVSVSSFSDLSRLVLVLVTAFITGAIHAAIEMYLPTLPATTTSIVTTTALKTPPVL